MAGGFNVDKVRALMRTKPGEAIFWSGTTSFAKPQNMPEEEYRAMMADMGGEETAKAFARAHDGKTLEMLMEENRDALIEAGFPYDEERGQFVYSDGSPNSDGSPSKWGDTREYWDEISDAFAQGASGQVRVVFGNDENDLREDADENIHSYESTWHRAELSRIKRNPNITGVTALDPFSHEEIDTFTPDEIVVNAQYEPRDYSATPDAAHIESSFFANESAELAAASIPQNETHAETSQNDSAQSASRSNGFQSSYADRIRQTPSLESNRWAGERGEAVCAPQSDAAKQILQERGIAGVQYQNGVPDFSPFSESTVKLGYMTDARHSRGLDEGRDGKNTIYAHFEDDELVSRSHRADKSSMSDLHMKYDKPGNFEQADILTAEQWTADGREDREWTAEDVAQYRQENGLTWHECNDRETMQMIPEAINADFGHLGGVAEVKETQRIVNEVLRDDEDQILEEKDYDAMSPEDVDSLKREHGHYDEEGAWISDAQVESDAEEVAVDGTAQESLGTVEAGLDAAEAEIDESADAEDASLDLSDNGENDDPSADERVDADDDLPDEECDGDVLPEGESQIDEKFDDADADLNNSDFDEELESEEVEEQAEWGAEEQAEQEAAEQGVEEQTEQEAAEQEMEEQAEQETAEQEMEEQAEREAAEQEEEQAEQETAEQEMEEQAEQEAAEQEIEEQAEQEAAEQEAAEQEIEEQAEQETAEQEIEEQAEQETAEQEIEEQAEQDVEEQVEQETAEQEAEEQAAQETIDEHAGAPDCNDLEDTLPDEFEDDPDCDDLEDESSDEPLDDPDYDDLVDESSDESLNDPDYDDLADESSDESLDDPDCDDLADESSDEPLDDPDCDDLADESSDEPLDDPDYDDLADESSDESLNDPDYDDLADESSDESLNDPDYDDLADESSDEPLGEQDCSDLADESTEASMDDTDYSDLADETTKESVDDAADCIEPGSFDGGDDSIE